MDVQALFQYPIIQGPMAGGASCPLLVAAVSNAGGLGSSAMSLLAPDVMRYQVGQIRALTAKPFMLNLFIQAIPHPDAAELARATLLLKPVWSALGWNNLPMPAKWCENFELQFDVILETRPAAASFTFGILSAAQVERLHEAGILVIGTVTTVAEALAWQAVGADAVVASGVESGGHRGTFLGPQTEATLTSFELLPQVVKAVGIPVIAAGGIMDGATINQALALGATAVQMGTAFLVTEEAGIHPAYKQRLLDAEIDSTRLTRTFSGRYARGLENRFMQLMLSSESEVPAYPVQNALTGAIRAAAADAGDTEFMSLWAGTGVHQARAMPAAQLIATLVAEMRV